MTTEREVRTSWKKTRGWAERLRKLDGVELVTMHHNHGDFFLLVEFRDGIPAALLGRESNRRAVMAVFDDRTAEQIVEWGKEVTQ